MRLFNMSSINNGQHLGDIVVGDVGDIGQPQCHKYIKKQNILVREKKKSTYDIVVDQCHQP